MSTMQKKKCQPRKSREQVVKRKSFGRPPESVVKNCRARMGRLIANDSEAGRQRAKVSSSKKSKKAFFDFSNFRSAV
jgi:hypothetical protein